MRAWGVHGSAEEGQVFDYAPDVVRIATGFVNAYLVGTVGHWVLVDTGFPGFGRVIRRAAKRRFGRASKPVAILLTHGHFDHSGNVDALARYWDVPVYAHALELSYLAGRSQYPPQDPTVGGALAFLSRVFPPGGHRPVKTKVLPLGNHLPAMPEWRWIHTPGHTPGHVSFFRDTDRVLLTGDALATMDLDSWTAQMWRRPQLCRPPAPLTADWTAAEESVREIASLAPYAIAAGHGLPLAGIAVAQAARYFAATFAAPVHGRYISEPAAMGPAGLEWVPPPVPDPLPRTAAKSALVVLGGLGLAAAGRRLRRA